MELGELVALLGDRSGGGILKVAEDVTPQEIAVGLQPLVLVERDGCRRLFWGGGRGRWSHDVSNCRLPVRAFARRERAKNVGHPRMRADKPREVAPETGALRLRGQGDPLEVSPRACVPAGCQEERHDDRVRGRERRGEKKLGKQGPVKLKPGSRGRLHRGGRNGADRFAQGFAQTLRHRVPNLGRLRRRPAVIDDDHRRPVEAQRGGRLDDPLGRDRGEFRREPRGEGEVKAGLDCQRLQILPKAGANSPLRADKEGYEDKFPLAGGELLPDPGFERPRPCPVEGRPGMRSLCFQDTAANAIPARFPTAAAIRRRFRWASGSREPLSISAAFMGQGRRPAQASNQERRSAQVATAPMITIAGRQNPPAAARAGDRPGVGKQEAVVPGCRVLHDRGRGRREAARRPGAGAGSPRRLCMPM